mmetsp:Transcript_2708/g.5940  ORF Transcript_2708/g.5940 Transcript_2708/m.5940 type:complete len:85 (+) Transcript_2708:59-313(+)
MKILNFVSIFSTHMFIVSVQKAKIQCYLIAPSSNPLKTDRFQLVDSFMRHPAGLAFDQQLVFFTLYRHPRSKTEIRLVMVRHTR